jgi:hypothetical protein
VVNECCIFAALISHLNSFKVKNTISPLCAIARHCALISMLYLFLIGGLIGQASLNVITNTNTTYPSGLDNTICSNDIYGQLGYDRGIGGYMSPGEITCNKIWNTRQSLYFTGDNEMNDAISGNEMFDTHTGIHVNSPDNFSAILGTQFLRGNKFDNNWVYGGRWAGDATNPNIADSQFDNNEIYPYTPPSLTVVPSDWFKPVPDNNEFDKCETIAGIASAYCEDKLVGEKTLVTQAKFLPEPYRSMVLRKAWADINTVYPNGNAPTPQKEFVDEYAQTGFAKLAQIDYILANPLANQTTLTDKISTLKTTLQGLEENIKTEHTVTDALSFEERVALFDQEILSPTALSFYSLGQELAHAQEQAESLKEQQWLLAKSLNAAIFEDTNPTAVEKVLNDIYLDMLIAKQSWLSVTDSMYVRSVAYACPQEKGDAVFKARALWLSVGEPIDKAWDLCYEVTTVVGNRQDLQEGKGQLTVPFKPEVPTIYPIPMADEMAIAIPTEYVGAQYEVINTAGISIANGQLQSETTKVNASTWSNGLHFVRILTKDKRPITIKIVVQKL